MTSDQCSGSYKVRSKKPYVELWHNIYALLKEFWNANKIATVISVVIVVIGNARAGLHVFAMGGLIDTLINGEVNGHSIVYWLTIYVIASFLEEFYWIANPLLKRYLLDHGSYRIQHRILQQASATPLIQFEDSEFFERLQRAKSGMGERLVGLFHNLMDLAQLLVMMSSVAIALGSVHPVLLPLLFIGSVPSLWLQSQATTAIYKAHRKHSTTDRVNEHLKEVLTGRETAAELRTFRASSFLIARWKKLRDARNNDVLRAERDRARVFMVGNLVLGGAYIGGLVLVTGQILHQKLSVGDYVIVATGTVWLQQMLTGVVTSLRNVVGESRFLGDLFDFWELAYGRKGGTSRTGSRGASASGRHTGEVKSSGMSIKATRLTFSYPSSGKSVLRGIDLHIAPGERVAIVGENGAGKSTLVKLLSGLYQPDSGVIDVDGQRLTAENAANIRRRIAPVFQDYVTYWLTARENIGFGDLPQIHNDEMLHIATSRAGLSGLVTAWPQGYDTYLGPYFGGTDLSGGQWQRIALARAAFRDADVVVLDEPTASLDPKAEMELVGRFLDVAGNRTVIIIAHRLGVARLMDRIVVVEQGTVVEDGNHTELLKRGGIYARLFTMQAKWYM